MFTKLIQKYSTRGTNALSKIEPEFYQYLKDTTAFLPSDASSTQRLWHHISSTFAVPQCDMCTSPVNWNIVTQQYRKYCSRQCSPPKPQNRTVFKTCAVCNNRLKRNKYTTCSTYCRQIYDEHQSSIVLPLEELKHQLQLLPTIDMFNGFKIAYPCLYHNIQQYTEHLPASYQIKERIAYVIDPAKYDAKITAQQTTISEATDLGITVQELSIRSRYANNMCPKCMTRQRPVNLDTRKLKKWCTDCTNQFSMAQQALNLAKLDKITKPIPNVPGNKNTDTRLNNPDWLYDQHYNHKLTKQQLATLIGVDKETVSNRFKLYGIKSIKHKFKTAQQNEVLDFIKSLGISNIIENDRTLVPPKQIDIYLPDHNLAIEYCGLYWHSTSQERITPSYHKHKMDQCRTKGVRLLTIFSNEWIDTRRICELKIESILGLDARKVVYGRTTTVSAITADKKRDFFEVNHIQGNGPSSYNIALQDVCGTPVAVMGFIISDNGNTATLNRYATSCRVVGGFSKLLKYAINHQSWTRIVSFADLRWSDGNLYEKTGFALEATIPPDYYYTKGAELIHKFNFRHSRLPKMLGELYDPTMSETENTKRSKWYQIFDCGKQRWVMNL